MHKRKHRHHGQGQTAAGRQGPMDKVKIQRVKRNKKQATAGEKILAGIGLGSTLMGGSGSVTAQNPSSGIVRESPGSQDGTSKIKQTLQSIFGIRQAKADTFDDAVAAARQALDSASRALASFDDWAQRAQSDVEGTGDPDSARYYEENPDAAEQRMRQIEGEINRTRPGLVQAVRQAELALQNATDARGQAHPDGDNGDGQPGGETIVDTAKVIPFDQLTEQQRQEFVSTFEFGQNQDKIPSNFGNSSAFAYALGLGDGSDGLAQRVGADGKTYNLTRDASGNPIWQAMPSSTQQAAPTTIQQATQNVTQLYNELHINPQNNSTLGQWAALVATGQVSIDQVRSALTNPQNPPIGKADTLQGRMAHWRPVVNSGSAGGISVVMELVEDPGHHVLNPNGFWYMSDGNNGWILDDGQFAEDGVQIGLEEGVSYKSEGHEWVRADGSESFLESGHNGGETTDPGGQTTTLNAGNINTVAYNSALDGQIRNLHLTDAQVRQMQEQGVRPGSVLAYMLGLGDSLDGTGLAYGLPTRTDAYGTTYYMVSGKWVIIGQGETSAPPSLQDVLAKARTMPFDQLTLQEQDVFFSHFSNGENAGDVPSLFSAGSAFAFALGWDSSIAERTWNGTKYYLQNGSWSTQRSGTVNPGDVAAAPGSSLVIPVTGTNAAFSITPLPGSSIHLEFTDPVTGQKVSQDFTRQEFALYMQRYVPAGADPQAAAKNSVFAAMSSVYYHWGDYAIGQVLPIPASVTQAKINESIWSDRFGNKAITAGAFEMDAHGIVFYDATSNALYLDHGDGTFEMLTGNPNYNQARVQEYVSILRAGVSSQDHMTPSEGNLMNNLGRTNASAQNPLGTGAGNTGAAPIEQGTWYSWTDSGLIKSNAANANAFRANWQSSGGKITSITITTKDAQGNPVARTFASPQDLVGYLDGLSGRWAGLNEEEKARVFNNFSPADRIMYTAANAARVTIPGFPYVSSANRIVVPPTSAVILAPYPTLTGSNVTGGLNPEFLLTTNQARAILDEVKKLHPDAQVYDDFSRQWSSDSGNLFTVDYGGETRREWVIRFTQNNQLVEVPLTAVSSPDKVPSGYGVAKVGTGSNSFYVSLGPTSIQAAQNIPSGATANPITGGPALNPGGALGGQTSAQVIDSVSATAAFSAVSIGGSGLRGTAFEQGDVRMVKDAAGTYQIQILTTEPVYNPQSKTTGYNLIVTGRTTAELTAVVRQVLQANEGILATQMSQALIDISQYENLERNNQLKFTFIGDSVSVTASRNPFHFATRETAEAVATILTRSGVGRASVGSADNGGLAQYYITFPGTTYQGNAGLIATAMLTNGPAAAAVLVATDLAQNRGDYLTRYVAGTPSAPQNQAVAAPTAVSVVFDQASAGNGVPQGGTFSATFSGQNLSASTYFDVKVILPGETQERIANNWQVGATASHPVDASSPAGQWKITGIRAHAGASDHSGNFAPANAVLRVTPANGEVSASAPVINQFLFDPVAQSRGVSPGGTFTASVIGQNITQDTYFDILAVLPGESTPREALNWQKGFTQAHAVDAGTSVGIWTVTGIRAHAGASDHSGTYKTLNAQLRIIPAAANPTAQAPVIGGIQGFDPVTNEYTDIVKPGTYLVLYGTFAGEKNNEVRIDGNAVSVSGQTANQINVMLPSGFAAGSTHKVIVVNAGGNSNEGTFTIGSTGQVAPPINPTPAPNPNPSPAVTAPVSGLEVTQNGRPVTSVSLLENQSTKISALVRLSDGGYASKVEVRLVQNAGGSQNSQVAQASADDSGSITIQAYALPAQFDSSNYQSTKQPGYEDFVIHPTGAGSSTQFDKTIRVSVDPNPNNIPSPATESDSIPMYIQQLSGQRNVSSLSQSELQQLEDYFSNHPAVMPETFIPGSFAASVYGLGDTLPTSENGLMLLAATFGYKYGGGVYTKFYSLPEGVSDGPSGTLAIKDPNSGVIHFMSMNGLTSLGEKASATTVASVINALKLQAVLYQQGSIMVNGTLITYTGASASSVAASAALSAMKAFILNPATWIMAGVSGILMYSSTQQRNHYKMDDTQITNDVMRRIQTIADIYNSNRTGSIEDEQLMHDTLAKTVWALYNTTAKYYKLQQSHDSQRQYVQGYVNSMDATLRQRIAGFQAGLDGLRVYEQPDGTKGVWAGDRWGMVLVTPSGETRSETGMPVPDSVKNAISNPKQPTQKVQTIEFTPRN